MPIRLHVLFTAARHAVASSSVLIRRLITFQLQLHLTPLLLHLSYFLAVDLLGFLTLVLLKPSMPGYRPRYVDVFFMSTSAVTVTGLATVEMEDLSAAQLAVLTLLMLLGSEAFVSFLGLILHSSSSSRSKREHHDRRRDHDGRSRATTRSSSSSSAMAAAAAVCAEPDTDLEVANNVHDPAAPSSADSSGDAGGDDRKEETAESSFVGVRSLAVVLAAYTAAALVGGTAMVYAYVSTVATARAVLERKGISTALFSASATVSSFTNGGLLPTNESMAVFATNRGLLLLLAAQILAGGTLLPVFLSLTARAAAALFTGRRVFLPGEEKSAGEEEGFGHLVPVAGGGKKAAAVLAGTVVAVAAAAAGLLCCLNWNSAVFAGLTGGEKVANAVFMAVNVRQAGENSVDCSLAAPAVLVLFLAMMCIPASATFFSFKVPDDGAGERKRIGGGEESERKDDDGAETKERRRRLTLNSMLLSPLACNAAAVMVACITERRSIAGDPLNFSTFNVIFEVISAYGNVGLSTGYSCSRLLPAAAADGCHDKPYSFSGWWSDQGKMLIVLLMLYGRLKGFHGQRRRR